MQRLRDKIETGSVYKGYEGFRAEFAFFRNELPCEEQQSIEEKIAAYFSQYRIQKFAFLEQLALCRAWEKRYIPAICAFKELIAFIPWNEEAHTTLPWECAYPLEKIDK